MMERNINTNQGDTFRGFEIWATLEYILVSFFPTMEDGRNVNIILLL